MAPPPALPFAPASSPGPRAPAGRPPPPARALGPASPLYSAVVASARDNAAPSPVQLVTVTAVSGESEEVDLGAARVASGARAGASGRNGYLEFPAREGAGQARSREPPLVRVRLSVHYRVHSRQMLCIGGSQIPFGWSFLSIAKVPMAWTAGDLWTAEVVMPANSRIEYKYVILEEQDWTKQESEDAEGVVTFSYRTQPDSPPDIQTIQKQMAIVAWQPGPNRIVQVPSEEEFSSLREGEVRERMPARAPSRTPPQRRFAAGGFVHRATNALLGIAQPPGNNPIPDSTPDNGTPSGAGEKPPLTTPPSADDGRPGPPPVSSPFPDGDELAGTWEALSLDKDSGEPLLERRDVWGFSDSGGDQPKNRGVRFG